MVPIDILSRWQSRTRNKRFVFGLLSSRTDVDDDEIMRRLIQTKGRSVDTSLKNIGERIGLPFKLHFHVARHTFAVCALNIDHIPLPRISQMLGHQSVEVTSQVYARFVPNLNLPDDV